MTPKQFIDSDQLNTVLVDIRRSEERKNNRFVEGSLHLPMEEIIMSDDIDLPKDTHLVILCERGGRAEIVVGNLKAKGFSNVEKLDGGYEELKKLLS